MHWEFLGKYGADGQIEQYTQCCLVSGELIEPGDVTIALPDGYFCLVKARHFNQATHTAIVDAARGYLAPTGKAAKGEG